MIRSSSILSCAILGITLVINGTAFAEEGPTQHSVARLFERNRTYAAEENSVEQGVVLLDFFNDACGPCRSMMPAVNSLVQRGYRISKVNTDQYPDWARRFNITKIPCFVVIVNGQEVARHTGVTSEQKLESLIAKAGGTPNLRPQTLKSESRQLAQAAESAWKGRETKLDVQDIVEGRYVFPNGLEAASVSERVASNAGNPVESGLSGAALTPVSASASGWQSGNAVPAETAQLHAKVLSSTVRICVNDANGQGCGTGTLIDCRSGHALILTCGHLFREFQSGDSITVTLFTANGTVTLPARYVNHDEERDLGLLSLTVQNSIEISPIASTGFRLQKGMPVVTSGCSSGADPTIQTGVITNLNRFLGTPNIEVSAVPVQGRSGGGMFAANGALIGVCFAANPDDREGIFTSLEAIHDYFRSLKMEQFVLNPRNESRPASNEEETIALNELPVRAPSAAAPTVAAADYARASHGADGISRTANSSSFTQVSETSARQNVSGNSIVSTEFQSDARSMNSGLKSAEPSVVSLANVDTVQPILPAEGNGSATPAPAPGTLIPNHDLNAQESPSWPPTWNE